MKYTTFFIVLFLIIWTINYKVISVYLEKRSEEEEPTDLPGKSIILLNTFDKYVKPRLGDRHQFGRKEGCGCSSCSS